MEDIKGFTLTKLLASIAIFVIIVSVGTLLLLDAANKGIEEELSDGVINTTAADSVYSLMDATKIAYTEALLDGINLTFPITVVCDGITCNYTDSTTASPKTGVVDFDGTVPTAGTVVLTASGRFDTTAIGEEIIVNNLKCRIDATNKVTCGA